MAGYATPAWANGTSPAINAANLLALGQAAELAEHPYGVCSTAAATAAKSVTIDYSGTLSLFAGLTIRVKFSNSNSAANPTLNVNSTGAKSIMSYGTTHTTTWVAGQILEFTYDGTYWLVTGIDGFPKTQQLTPATAAVIGNFSGSTPITPDQALNNIAVSCGKIAAGSYVGTGTFGSDNPNKLNLGFAPKFAVVYTSYGLNAMDGEYWDQCFIWAQGIPQTRQYAPGELGGSNVAATSTALSWWSSSAGLQLNTNGTTYYYVVMGQ